MYRFSATQNKDGLSFTRKVTLDLIRSSFNKGLSQIYLGNVDGGLADMPNACAEKATDEHNVIDYAIQDCEEGIRCLLL